MSLLYAPSILADSNVKQEGSFELTLRPITRHPVHVEITGSTPGGQVGSCTSLKPDISILMVYTGTAMTVSLQENDKLVPCFDIKTSLPSGYFIFSASSGVKVPSMFAIRLFQLLSSDSKDGIS